MCLSCVPARLSPPKGQHRAILVKRTREVALGIFQTLIAWHGHQSRRWSAVAMT